MGKFKEIGNPALALAEECAEVIQVINKKFRFDGDWNEIPEGNTKSRLEELESEMEDLLYQYERFLLSIGRQNSFTNLICDARINVEREKWERQEFERLHGYSIEKMEEIYHEEYLHQVEMEEMARKELDEA